MEIMKQNVTDVDGVGAEHDGMTEGDGDEDVGGGEMEPRHCRVRLDPRRKPTQEKKGTWSNTFAVLSSVCTLHDGKRSNSSSRDRTTERCSSWKGRNLQYIRFSEANLRRTFSDNATVISNVHCDERMQTPDHDDQGRVEERR